MSTTPRVGTEFAGYRIEALIGRGGMSVVYLAEHLRLGRKVALKILAENLADDEAFRERFVRESRLAASLDHPNVIPIFEAGESDGVLYLSMRYVQGSDLKSLIEQQGALDPLRTVSVISQVGNALDAAHLRGLTHRDVKPGNVLIASGLGPEQSDHVYLCDFGLTKHTESRSGLTRTGQFVGTLDYVSPEQVEGKPVDGRSDIYALGCVLYECLTGDVPYQKDSEAAVLWAHLREDPPSATRIRPELPPGVDSVIETAMAKSPEDRFQTARDLVVALRRELGMGGQEQRQTISAAGGGSATAVGPAIAAVPGQTVQGSRPSAPETVAASSGQPPTVAASQYPPGQYPPGQYPPPGQVPPAQYPPQGPPPGQYGPGGYGPPPGGPPAPGGYGPPPPRRGPNRGLLIGIGVGVLALAAILLIFFLTRGGDEDGGTQAVVERGEETPTVSPPVTPTAAPTVTPTAAPTVTPTATPFTSEEQRLLTHIPEGIQRAGCRSFPEGRPANAVAALICNTGGKEVVSYSLFDSQSEMDRYFTNSADENLGPGAGDNCAEDRFAQHTWSLEGGGVTGRVACYRTGRGSFIEWTDNRFLIYSVAFRSDFKDLELYRFWFKRAGPVP